MASTLITLSLATSALGWGVVGFGNSAGRLNESEAAAWNEANSNPNASHSVRFNPYEVGDSNLQFTWTVNVTDISVPSGSRAVSSSVDNPRVINTVHSFSWPESAGEYLNDTLPGTNPSTPFCISLFYNGLPDNVTDAYTSGDANNASCAPALGDACVNALTGALNYGAGVAGCPTVSAWIDLPECRGTGLNVSSIASTSINDRSNLTYAPNATSSYPLGSGNSFAFYQGDVYSGSNASALEEGESRLQLMVVSNAVRQGEATAWNSQALCMRVRTDTSAAVPRGVVATGAVVLAVMTAVFNLM
ncbi:hypothetical protein K431DRAFT_287307 [Polychaeton citri CBS 116435]|uniref:Uncharacterized protein n=1 Tax=Polychaeton citri CBS 116435 TaxID=1314669 RepID=A0A9P4Q1G8_9PEZI|nr:hypothetical protein K431DRAFT_287307 [Polychaeton citri CBS 116435]